MFLSFTLTKLASITSSNNVSILISLLSRVIPLNSMRDSSIKLFKSNNQWTSISKGSIIQYALAYPGDEQLQKWKSIAERILINEL